MMMLYLWTFVTIFLRLHYKFMPYNECLISTKQFFNSSIDRISNHHLYLCLLSFGKCLLFFENVDVHNKLTSRPRQHIKLHIIHCKKKNDDKKMKHQILQTVCGLQCQVQSKISSFSSSSTYWFILAFLFSPTSLHSLTHSPRIFIHSPIHLVHVYPKLICFFFVFCLFDMSHVNVVSSLLFMGNSFSISFFLFSIGKHPKKIWKCFCKCCCAILI